MVDIIKTSFSVIGCIIGLYIGTITPLLIALVIFMIVDYCTGIFRAIIDHKLSSSIGFHGLLKKISILLLIGVANIIDINVIGNGNVIRSTVTCFYISNEGISILENISKIGVPIPEKIKNVLLELQESKDE